MDCPTVVIIGGGIVGLATAHTLARRERPPRVVVLEKEKQVCAHQSGRSSGVLHSGIYYRPGSLKARNCLEGRRAMLAFCAEHGIRHEVCGKVIVAVDHSEVPVLEGILERGRSNGVRCEPIGPERLRELEPHAAGVRAIHVPDAGIVDYLQVCERMVQIVRARGGEVVTGARVTSLTPSDDGVVVVAGEREYPADLVVNCSGLHVDRLTRLSGVEPSARIVPFRGEFYELTPGSRGLCRNLIYPVPDPRFPFLGVHFTRRIDGSVECGPNAVLAFAREGYRKLDVNLRDLTESLTYPGFLRLAARHLGTGIGEMWRSISKPAFVRALRRLIPDLREDDLVPTRSGVRAQAVARDGSMVDDFLIERSGRIVNVGNAPSPAATSALNIAALIAEKLEL